VNAATFQPGEAVRYSGPYEDLDGKTGVVLGSWMTSNTYDVDFDGEKWSIPAERLTLDLPTEGVRALVDSQNPQDAGTPSDPPVVEVEAAAPAPARPRPAWHLALVASVASAALAATAVWAVKPAPEVVEVIVSQPLPPVCVQALDDGDTVMEKWDQVDLHDAAATNAAAAGTDATYGRNQDDAIPLAETAAEEVALRDAAQIERDDARTSWDAAKVQCRTHRPERIAQ